MPTDSFLPREVFSFCHEFTLILKFKWRDLNSRLGGCGICASEIYFSIFLENKEEKKTEVTLSLILRLNLRLGGYSIWSASTSRTIYDQDFRAWAPHSLEANGSTWRTTRRIWRKDDEASPHKRRLKCDTNISPRWLMTHLLHQMVHHRTTLRGNGQL